MKGNKAHGYTAQMSILYHKVGKASILVVEAKALYIRRIRQGRLHLLVHKAVGGSICIFQQ